MPVLSITPFERIRKNGVHDLVPLSIRETVKRVQPAAYIALSDSKLSYQSISVIGMQKNLRPTAPAFPINARHWESLPFYSRHRCGDGKHKELG